MKTRDYWKSSYEAKAYASRRRADEALYRYAKKFGTVETLLTQTMSAAMHPTTATSSPNQEFFSYPRYRTTQGRVIYGVRLENTEPGHDKEYTITVVEKPLASAGSPAKSMAAEYIVEAAWGRIGNTLSTQTKSVGGQGSTSNKTRAVESARDLERSKKAKGYHEILRYEETAADAAVDADSFDWVITDDLLVDPNSPVTPTAPAAPPRECTCYYATEELSTFAYADPEPADLSIAPLLMSPDYGLIKYPDLKRGPRWLVTVLASCEGGYVHARAIPAGEAFDAPDTPKSLKRSTPQYVEDLVIEEMAAKAKKDADLTVLVEERGIDLLVLDAFRWNGIDLTEAPWDVRRATMDPTFRSVFAHETKTQRGMELLPRVVNRLRETYLAEGEKLRFELYAKGALPGTPAWSLPKL